MSKPRLLDLFCGAGVLHSGRANHLRLLCQRGRSAASDQEVLLDGLRSTPCPRLAEDTSVSPLWCRVRGARAGRRQPPALFERVRQESRHQDCALMDRGTSRNGEGLPPESTSKGPGLRPETVAGSSRTHSRFARSQVCCLRSDQSSLAPRRFYPYRQGAAVSTPAALPVCLGAPRPIPRSLCESPLRADPYGPDRRFGHYAVVGGR
jgi:hypothetical protein